MAEDKKEFPWIQLIATIGTIVAALIGITPYLLKLNSTPAPQTPTIVVITLPPAVVTPVPFTPQPATTVETTAAVTQTTVATTAPATTGPPVTGNETPVETATTTPATTAPVTTVTTLPTATPTLPPGPAIQISVNTTSVPQGGFILASGTTDPSVTQVLISLKNSTTFQSAAVPVTLTQGAFQFQVDTSTYAPGDYTISAAVPDTQAVAQASFVITAA